MRCRPCGKEWTGLKMCHCARCHRTFSTVTVFDAHQTAREDWACHDPNHKQYETNDAGVWKRVKNAAYDYSKSLSAVGGTS